MTSAFPISPAVKMFDPRRPFPVFSSGKSPFASRRSAKYPFGMRIEKRPLGSTKSLMGTGGAVGSSVFMGTGAVTVAVGSSARAAWNGTQIMAPKVARDPSQPLRLTVIPSSESVHACTRVQLTPRDALSQAKEAEKADDLWTIDRAMSHTSVLHAIRERILDLFLSCAMGSLIECELTTRRRIIEVSCSLLPDVMWLMETRRASE
jgi:hypothetical protein